MMKIKETKIKYLTDIVVGKIAFFIYLDREGIIINDKELLEQALHFNTVVVVSDNHNDSRADVSKFLKALKKKKSDIKLVMISDGTTKPTGLTGLDMVYIVNILLKNSYVAYKKRVDFSMINWYDQNAAYFLFDVHNKDDVDEAAMIIHDAGINKDSCYMKLFDNFDKLLKYARTKNFNVTFELDHIYNKILNKMSEYDDVFIE